jgi:hypothetical protein
LFYTITHAAHRVPLQHLQGLGSHKSRCLCLQLRCASFFRWGYV